MGGGTFLVPSMMMMDCLWKLITGCLHHGMRGCGRQHDDGTCHR